MSSISYGISKQLKVAEHEGSTQVTPKPATGYNLEPLSSTYRHGRRGEG
jgi:hypothetical protein